MTTYYQSATARITHNVFESWNPTYRSFAIRELQHVHTVRERTAEIVAASAPVRVCSTGMAAVTLLVTAATAPTGHSSTTAMVIAFAASSTVAAFAWRAYRRPREVRAFYRGELVCLFRSSDPYALGQVKRALLRVRERIEDGR